MLKTPLYPQVSLRVRTMFWVDTLQLAKSRTIEAKKPGLIHLEAFLEL